MNNKADRPEQAAKLRRQAEKIAREEAPLPPKDLDDLSLEEIRRILHELQVHQIELEMQNKELRRIQEELDAERERYFDFYNLAPVGYFTLSEKGLILEANITAATLLGVGRGMLIKQPISRFILKEDQDNYYLHRRQLFETGKPQAFDLRMVKKDGAVFWVHLETSSKLDVGGVPVCRIVLNDITMRKQAEEERERLEAKNRQLQKAEGLGRMAGAIAHHFNNKLHAVMGCLELVLKSLPEENESFNDLTTAMQAADQAAEVSRLMLTYLGQANGVREPLDLSETCRNSLPLIQASMPKNVALVTDFLFPGPTIKANANQIQLILTNLMSNSWEAIGERQGTIQLSVTTVSSADIPSAHRFPINWQANDEPCAYACLEVWDSGCGLTKKDIEEVFDPFFSTKFTGRGLGLSVVLGLVQAHCGVATVESTPALGSIFRVYFPIVAKEVQRQPGKAANAPEIKGGGTVLLIDDDKIVLDITSTALSLMGFKVLTAMDGIEAVEVLQRHKDEILLVLSDFAMPRMNGLETLTALRQIVPDIPVILASGYSEEQVMGGTHPERPQAFLGKPYGLQKLKNAISQSLTDKKRRIKS